MTIRKAFSLVAVILLILSAAIPVSALSETEKIFLSMYFTDEELVVVSATRSLKSITRVAENIEVVTKEQIELLGAHNIGQVLDRIIGLQSQALHANPLGFSAISIQGSKAEQVAVFLDGALINDMAGNRPDYITTMPSHIVERIEIIKGPASSSWGTSLGGVVNIITKSAGSLEKPSGTVKASYGEKKTSDLEAEVYGKIGRVGYYVAAKHLESGEFHPKSDFLSNNIYAKLFVSPSQSTDIQWTFMYNKAGGMVALFPDWGVYDKDLMETILTTFLLKHSINSKLDIEVSLKYHKNRFLYTSFFADTGKQDFSYIIDTHSERYSANAKISWRQGIHSIVAGSDIEQQVIKMSAYDYKTLQLNKAAVYINDTMRFGDLTIIPGLRLDYASATDLFLSPSVGVTYMLGKESLLRLFIARGFNDPTTAMLKSNVDLYEANPDLKRESVWSYQAGIETGVLNYFWLKVSAFDHEISNSIDSATTSSGKSTHKNLGPSRRKGLEIEIKTLPFHNFTLSAGSMVMRSKDIDTGKSIKDNPTSTIDLSLAYDDKKNLRGILTGHYINWDSATGRMANDSAMVFDINLIKKIHEKGVFDIELFATGHNIFNGSQYWERDFTNAGRWVEAGVRVKF